MRVIGIDPGLEGAVAMIELAGGVAVEDTPILHAGKGDKRAYDTAAMLALLERMAGGERTLVMIEKAQAMPKQGVTSSFSIGFGFGIWIGMAVTLRLPYELVRPRSWVKALMADAPRAKDASIARAKELFPEAAERLTLKKHHGRAEALLIAEYGRRRALGAHLGIHELERGIPPLTGPATVVSFDPSGRS